MHVVGGYAEIFWLSINIIFYKESHIQVHVHCLYVQIYMKSNISSALNTFVHSMYMYTIKLFMIGQQV